MTDRELMELAAKAYGLQVKGWVGEKLSYFDDTCNHAGLGDWRPLTDDGDRARLESTLMLSIRWCMLDVEITDSDGSYLCSEYYLDHEDRQKARRYASVRAAALIAGLPADHKETA